jgi:antitoxin Phd
MYNISEVIDMLVNTKAMISLTEANQNFSRVARAVDEQGSVMILKNNVPRYLVIDIRKIEKMDNLESKRIEAIAEQIIEDNLTAFKALAK